MKRVQRGEDGSKSIDRISELPQGILQRILYLLSQKEAVRTSVLSKSWRHIWCTRPNVYFSEVTSFKGNKRKFLSVVDNTLQLYCDQKLCVKKFGLCILLDDLAQESVSLLEKWIPLLTTMGVKDFRLTIRSENNPGFIHMPSVVFGAESLKLLHVENFMLDKKDIERIVLFKHLKELRLKKVDIEDEIFQRIISRCPLIETMNVEKCERLKKIKVEDLPNLKYCHFYFHKDEEERCSIEIHTPSIKIISIFYGNIWFHERADFRNLRSLYLWGVDSSLEHLSSCEFPSLERLTLRYCDGLEEVQLFIDAPNIKYFGFEGYFSPSISFATTYNVWDSEILLHSNGASSLWLLKLKKLLKSLSQSKISLRIKDIYNDHIMQENLVVPYKKWAKPVEIYCLKIKCDLDNLPSLLNELFRICRPRNIGNYVYSSGKDVIECLWNILMRRESGNEYGIGHEVWSNDLAEVRIQIKRRNRGGWRAITLSDTPNYKQGRWILTRFALKWKKSPK